MSHTITVEGGTSVRLPTAGKYCDRDIIITATGGGGSTQAFGFLDNTLTAIDCDATEVITYACRGLSAIKTVNLPNATEIGQYAFYGCEGMETFNAPKLTTLSVCTFYGCSSLLSINFPFVSLLPNQCFYQCERLTKADFGIAKSISTKVFMGAKALTTLILRKTDAIVTLGNINALNSTPIASGTGYVYVPKTLADGSDGVATYQAATNWATYANQIRAIEDYPEICGG